MCKYRLFSFLSAAVASILLVQSQSAVAGGGCYKDDDQDAQPQPAAYHPNEDVGGNQLSSRDLKTIQRWVNYWNKNSNKHFKVMKHEEDSNLDLQCLDCSADELDSALKFLLAANHSC